MKKTILMLALAAGTITGAAQTVVDRFNVGPYVVEYHGQGDAKYRLMDNVDLYEFFELSRDTTVISLETEVPVRHCIQISGKVGANRHAAKEFGLEGVWKQNFKENLYFNGGLSLVIDNVNNPKMTKRTMLEIGLPLQIELGRLNRQSASVYGLFGITPAVYTTVSTKVWENDKWSEGPNKKTGFLISPTLEFGGNIPVSATILRIGVYADYKINCTSGDFDVYRKEAGRFFLGAKIGVAL